MAVLADKDGNDTTALGAPQVFDKFSWMICMSTTLYCVFWALMCA